MKNLFFLFFIFSISPALLFCQKTNYFKNHDFTEADTLRGTLNPMRTCYDVTFYELNIKVDVKKKYISGFVDVHFDVLEDFEILQLDLYENMKINHVFNYDDTLKFDRKYNAFFVHFPEKMLKGTSNSVRVFYEGKPTISRQAPWDGGFVWKEDSEGNPWIGVACEGAGASLWWPNKDHLSDEPDSVKISVAVPNDLQCIANGNLLNTKELEDNYTQWNWKVSYPINNYNVTVNIGKYAHFEDVFVAQDDDSLQIDYYVMPVNLAKAKKQFQQTQDALKAYEHYFSKYPFWEDGLAFVETPYLGMEHQGAIAYGNKYMRGYLGGMIPLDMDWDYIIIHELGHEWWGNSISTNDHAEMWIHESFTTYMEALFVEYNYDYEAAIRYMKSQRPFIQNRVPIIGPQDVNFDAWGSSDHYYKGAWVLHTLRHAIADDEKYWAILKDFYNENQISNIDSKDFFNYVNEKTGRDWSKFFEQYLYHPQIPNLLYKLDKEGKNLKFSFKWEAIEGFDMPILVGKKGAYQKIFPKTDEVQTVVFEKMKKEEFEIPMGLFLINAKDKP